jgi:hypothetical protein
MAKQLVRTVDEMDDHGGVHLTGCGGRSCGARTLRSSVTAGAKTF